MALADEPDDIGADILAAMSGEPETPETQLSAPETIIPADSGEETAQEKADRVRDEHGRFAKADETVQSAPTEAQASPEPAKQTIGPPRSWTVEEKAIWDTLPPLAQQAALRRESEMLAGKQSWDTKAERFNKIDAVIAPHRDRLTLSGVEESVYIGRLAQADKMLTENPYQAIQEVARMYGIDLNQIAGGSPQQAFQPAQDPQISTLLEEVQALRAERQQEITQRQTSEQQAALAQIEAFATDPAHPYFDNVKTEIGALLQAGSAKDLQEAYDMACHARKDIRALLQAAAAAKPATLTKPGGPQVTGAQRGATPPAQAANQNANIEDDVRDAINQLAGRV